MSIEWLIKAAIRESSGVCWATLKMNVVHGWWKSFENNMVIFGMPVSAFTISPDDTEQLLASWFHIIDWLNMEKLWEFQQNAYAVWAFLYHINSMKFHLHKKKIDASLAFPLMRDR